MSTILKRPGGSKAETPNDLHQRLWRNWSDMVKGLLSDDQKGSWPLQVNIGRPRLTGTALLSDAVAIRDWIEAWQAVARQQDVQFTTLNRRRVGQMRIPESITFSDIDALANYLGRDAVEEFFRTRKRFEDLKVIDPRLNGLAPKWRTVAEMSDAEHMGLCDFIAQRQYDPEEVLSIREMMITGMDGKFLERRHAIMEEALAHIDLLQEGDDYRERLGFRADDRQTLWAKTHPEDAAGPFGTQQFAVRPSEISQFPSSIRQVTIVENIETFLGYEPKPGVCLFFGSGNAIAGMAPQMPFLEKLAVLYWGDLDSFGLKILSRLRRSVPHATSVMMDRATMTGIARKAWRHEPESDRYTGDIPNLTSAEAAALSLIRSGNHRIEQEHIRPGPEEQKILGLTRKTARKQAAIG